MIDRVQERSQLTSKLHLSFVTGESKSCSRGNLKTSYTLKYYFAKYTRTHKNNKNTRVELLLSTAKFSFLDNME